MKEWFVSKKFRPETMQLIAVIHQIMAVYASQDEDLSVRQLYYQLVTKNIIPNTKKSYARIKGIVNDARLAGLLDWDLIVDRDRKTVKKSHWDTPADVLDTAHKLFAVDLWSFQPIHIEVMAEKKAMEGIFTPACRALPW